MMKIPVVVGSLLTVLILLMLYLRSWLHRMLPKLGRLPRALLTAALWGASIYVFAWPSVVLLHFWLISAALDGICLLLHKKWNRLVRLAAPAVLTAAVLCWGVYNLAHPVATFYTYETEKAIRPEGYRIVLISDTHFGTIQKPEVLAAAIDEINELKPDLVVLGGDLVEEGTDKAQMQQVFRLLGGLESSFGSYMVYGNHDRQSYSRNQKYSVRELAKAVEENGITLLKNESVTINDALILAGLEDPSWRGDEPRQDTDRVLEGADREKLIVAADHQPNAWGENAAAGVDLQLSGHTHAGQIWPLGWFIRLSGGLNYGRYDLNGCTVIVSSGFAGWGFPFRTQERSEYVVIDIVPGRGMQE